MTVPSRDPVGDFVDACIDDAAKAKQLAAADPSLLQAQWHGDPLPHWMVIEDFAAGLTTLLDLGVPVDRPDDNGTTPLHQAARLGRLGVARMLLRRGADPNAFDAHFGENPLNLAVSNHHIGVAALLLEHGARGDYLLPGLDTVFRSMHGLDPATRDSLLELLAARGVTRDGLFRSLNLARHYGCETPEEAFGW